MPIHFLSVIRVCTIMVALVAFVASGPVSMLHVHDYVGHDHAEHKHGPAAHSHGQAEHGRHLDGGPSTTAGHRVESCDPGEHVVAVVFTCVTPIAHQALPADMTAVVRVTPPAVTPCRRALSDARAHSPPRLTDTPLRAPPVVHAA